MTSSVQCQEKGIILAKEALRSLSKEQDLSKEKVQSAFERAKKTLREQIRHQPSEFQSTAFTFIDSLYKETEDRFTHLQDCRSALGGDGAAAVSTFLKPPIHIRSASDSELWRKAVKRVSQDADVEFSIDSDGLPDDNELMQFLAYEVHEEFNDPVDGLKVFKRLVSDIAKGIFAEIESNCAQNQN